jgi:hypothetical protein
MTASLIFLYCLWLTPRGLQALIIIILLRKKLFSQFPIFTAYTAYSICNLVALFFINRSQSAHSVYFQWYSFGLGVSTALRFGIIGEVFSHLFRDYAVLRHLQRPLLRWTAVALIAIAFCTAVYTERNSVDLSWFAVHVLDRSASFVQGGLMLILFSFASYMGLFWRKPVFGIALGLGIFLSVELAVAAIRSQAGDSWPVALDLLTMGTYLCCVLIWLYYLLVPERSPTPVVDKIPDGDLEAWNQELEQLLHQ